ncbi:MAG: IS3 family transposase [Methylococcales bacterium]|nr:IS3 family transposase [Methylococcales bacterium]
MLESVAQKGLSQRAACRWSGMSRAMSRYKLRRPAQDAACLKKMRTAAQANPRYGYRRVAIVSGVGFGCAWRLWKRHGFKIETQRTRKPRKKDKSATPLPQQAEYPNHVWTYDILFDRLADGRPFKTLSVLDEFTRECLGILVATSILAEDVITFLSGILQQCNAPVFLRSDNGSEFTAETVRTWLANKKVGPAFIPPGQPWKNGFIESFHDKFRDECLQREWFSSLLDAQVLIADWHRHYNTQRPHSSLGYKTPAAFAAQYPTQFQPAHALIPVGHKN